MKIKYLLSSLILVVSLLLFCLPARAQIEVSVTPLSTNAPVLTGPGMEAFNWLTTPNASNWMVATYVIKTKTAGWGGGVGAIYSVSDFVCATLRCDVFDHSAWMPQGNIQLQAPVRIMGTRQSDGTVKGGIVLTPLFSTGVASQIEGPENQGGKVIGVVGIGLAGQLPDTGKWYVPRHLFIGYEKWTDGHGSGVRAGVTFPFGK